MKINLPRSVNFILESLKNNGFEAFIVGGCVRDILRGSEPKDWDIATSATPDKIKTIFDKTFDTGIEHGTVVVLLHGKNYEVTTYKNNEGNHPTLLYDLSKRDFTINAIAYNNELGIIDPYLGQNDISNKIIRAVGDTAERFLEDPLRMLRAIRFGATLKYEISDEVISEIKILNSKISSVSIERVREELTKIITSDPFKLEIIYKTGLLKYILPEFEECFYVEQNNPYHIYDVAQHILHCINHVLKYRIGSYIYEKPDYIKPHVLAWTMLLHDIGKPSTKTTGDDGVDHFYGHDEKGVEIARQILNRFKFDNRSISDILTQIKYHDYTVSNNKKSIKNIMSKIGSEGMEYLLFVKTADRLAQNPEKTVQDIINLDILYNLFNEIKNEAECYSISDLAINGDDLISLGIEPGKELGDILQGLLDEVIENPEINTKEDLLNIALSKKI